MKRLCNIIILLAVLVGLTACGNSSQTGQTDANSSATSKKEAGAMNQNGQSKENTTILVAYFSCTGTTKPLAEYAAEYLNADLYEIEAETPYTSADLDYNKSDSRANKEQDDFSARPAISGKVEDMGKYNIVVLAYPIWWGQAPRIISTFLESYDFNGKTIVPFCTSHSSGIGSSAANLHSLVDDSATWLEGRRFSASTSKEDITKWLEDSGIQSLLEQKKEEQVVGQVFDFNTKTVTLNSGYKMPLNGIGTYSLLGDICVSYFLISTRKLPLQR